MVSHISSLIFLKQFNCKMFYSISGPGNALVSVASVAKCDLRVFMKKTEGNINYRTP